MRKQNGACGLLKILSAATTSIEVYPKEDSGSVRDLTFSTGENLEDFWDENVYPRNNSGLDLGIQP